MSRAWCGGIRCDDSRECEPCHAQRDPKHALHFTPPMLHQRAWMSPRRTRFDHGSRRIARGVRRECKGPPIFELAYRHVIFNLSVSQRLRITRTGDLPAAGPKFTRSGDRQFTVPSPMPSRAVLQPAIQACQHRQTVHPDEIQNPLYVHVDVVLDATGRRRNLGGVLPEGEAFDDSPLGLRAPPRAPSRCRASAHSSVSPYRYRLPVDSILRRRASCHAQDAGAPGSTARDARGVAWRSQ
jgi:hypothetical protein